MLKRSGLCHTIPMKPILYFILIISLIPNNGSALTPNHTDERALYQSIVETFNKAKSQREVIDAFYGQLSKAEKDEIEKLIGEGSLPKIKATEFGFELNHQGLLYTARVEPRGGLQFLNRHFDIDPKKKPIERLKVLKDAILKYQSQTVSFSLFPEARAELTLTGAAILGTLVYAADQLGLSWTIAKLCSTRLAVASKNTNGNVLRQFNGKDVESLRDCKSADLEKETACRFFLGCYYDNIFEFFRIYNPLIYSSAERAALISAQEFYNKNHVTMFEGVSGIKRGIK